MATIRMKASLKLAAIALVAIGILARPAGTQGLASGADGSASAAAGLVVEHDEANYSTRIRIPARDGRIAWDDVVRGLALAERLDPDALEGVCPRGTLDTTGAGARVALVAINVALAPAIELRLAPPGAQEPSSLEIVIDRKAIEDTRRRLKLRLRRRIVEGSKEQPRGKFGLKLDAGWAEADPGQSLVILLHGYNSAPRGIEGLAQAVRRAGLPCGTYVYPNDGPLAESAQRLASDLEQLAREHPERGVALVTHSMGGLVARAAIEDPELYPSNVRQLVMIAPPTHGTLLAHFAFGTDIWEHWLQGSDRGGVSRFYAGVEDGLAEAEADLRPGSPFLRELNARPRNDQVRYSLFLGTGGPLEDDELEALRRAMATAGKRNRLARLFRPRVDEIVADLDEVRWGAGDGVVAVKRGRLEGVEDTVVLGFAHPVLAEPAAWPADRDLCEAVLARLVREEP